MTDLITVNEQSSIRIGGKKILYFDPLNIPEAAHDADIVFITHPHYDHYSPDDIAKISKGDTVIAAPESMRDEITEAGFTRQTAVFLKPSDKTEIEGIPVEAVHAYNTIKPFHPKRNGWLGYVVTVGGKRIYICGDTDNTPDAEAVRCDIVCIPIGGTYTMDSKKAAALLSKLRPEAAIPIHYGTLVGRKTDADDLERLVPDGTKIVRKLFL